MVATCRTVKVTTTVAMPSGRRMLKQYTTNYTRVFKTNTDAFGQSANFTQASPYAPHTASRLQHVPQQLNERPSEAASMPSQQLATAFGMRHVPLMSMHVHWSNFTST